MSPLSFARTTLSYGLLVFFLLPLFTVDGFMIVPSSSSSSSSSGLSHSLCTSTSTSTCPSPSTIPFVISDQHYLHLPSPTWSSLSSKLYFFGSGKKKTTSPDQEKADTRRGNERTNSGKTPYNYQGTKADKDEDVVVPATTYFAQKNDPIVPIIGGSFFLTIFSLLGWWLFSPTPEATVTNVKEMTYESMTQNKNSRK
jgi:hypothetical protein